MAIVFIALAGVFGYTITYTHFLKGTQYPVVRSDGAGYYSYLPAYFLERDPTFHRYVAEHLKGQTAFETGIKKNPDTGNYLQRYPVGEAVMVTPFFLTGHALARLAGARPDGFSGWEQGASGLAALFYLIGGLWILARLLRRYFTAPVVTVTLITIVFGTDLFHYSTFDSMFSHAFSFFLVAALLNLVHHWYERPSLRLVAGLGICMGLILLVRQANAVLFLALPLHGLVRLADIGPRLHLLWRQRLRLAIMAAIAAVVFAPQMWIWHKATGHWLVNSQAGDNVRFNFGSPRLLSTLFSFSPHGLFPWSPILLLACVGFFAMWKLARPLFWMALVVVVLDTYLIASWSIWFYGGGYGHRGFIDILPFFAIPLAALYSSLRSVASRVAVTASSAMCCGLVTVQMIHYWQLHIPFLGATWDQYVHLLTTPL